MEEAGGGGGRRRGGGVEAAGGGGGRRRRRRWRRRGDARARRRRAEVEAQRQAATGGARRWRRTAAASPGGGSLTALVGDQGARRRVRRFVGEGGQECQVPARAPSWGAVFRPLVPVGTTNRYQRSIGTGLRHQPVPKVHRAATKIARANRRTFGTGFSLQPVPKVISLFFFSCFIKTTITFEIKIQMT